MVNAKLIFMGLATLTLSIGVTGCASSKVTKTVQGAPITYKVGDGPAKYASLSTPRAPVSSRVPDYIPALPMPSRPAPRATAPLPTPLPAPQVQQQFDQASVDATTL